MLLLKRFATLFECLHYLKLKTLWMVLAYLLLGTQIHPELCLLHVAELALPECKG